MDTLDYMERNGRQNAFFVDEYSDDDIGDGDTDDDMDCPSPARVFKADIALAGGANYLNFAGAGRGFVPTGPLPNEKPRPSLRRKLRYHLYRVQNGWTVMDRSDKRIITHAVSKREAIEVLVILKRAGMLLEPNTEARNAK
jgi:hypothetical protein